MGKCMSLGNNRDYKTADKQARTLLARHAERMRDLQATGLAREEASRQAFRELSKPEANGRKG
jgi:hypothetical protein